MEPQTNRITGLDSDSRSTTAKIGFDEPKKRISLWLIVPAIVVLIGGIVVGAYFLLKKIKPSQEKSRLVDVQTATNVKNLAPSNIPQDDQLAHAIDLYKRNYLKPAKVAFSDIVESSKPAKVKSYALVFLGMMADEEGAFSRAIDYYRRAIALEYENFYAHYNLALALKHAGGNPGEALKESAIAASLRPDSVDAKILKGDIEHQNQDIDSSVKTMEDAARSKNPVALLKLGELYQEQGKMAEAKVVYRQAIDLAVAGEVAYEAANRLAKVFFGQGDFKNAQYYMKKAISLSPHNAKFYYNLAVVQYRLNDLEGAVNSLNMAIKKGKRDAKAYLHIARLLTDLGQTEQAERSLKIALEQAPLDHTIISQLADVLMKQAKWNEALRLLQRLLNNSTSTKEKALAYYNLGIIYTELKDWQNAKINLERAHELDSLSSDAVVALGDVYFNDGRPEKAIAKYREALRLNPENTKIHRALTKLYLDLGQLTEAEGSAQALLDHKKKDPEAYYFANYALGKVYQKREVYDSAIKYYEEALNDTNEEHRYRIHIALAMSQMAGNKPEHLALSNLKKAIALRPNSSLARLSLARALLKDGTIRSQEMAEEELTTIIQSTGVATGLSSKAFTLRGIIFYKRGQFMRALDEFTRALELDPSNQQAFQNKRAAVARIEEAG